MLGFSACISSGCAAPVFERADNPLLNDAQFSDQQDFIDFTSADGDGESKGTVVNKRNALGFAPLWRAITLVCGDLGVMPIWVSKRVVTDDGEGFVRDRKHPANILNRRPNRYMSRFDFIRTLFSHAFYRGNGYAFIRRNAGAKPLELLILDPLSTWPVRRNGELWYVTVVNGTTLKLPAEDVIHIKGFGDDGLQGFDLLTWCKKTIKAGLATRDYRISFFDNGATPGVVLECPGKMTPKVQKQVLKRWEKIHKGIGKQHRTAILQQGMTARTLSQNARDSQMQEAEEYNVFQISAVTGVPPHKIGGRGRQSYGSLEQENETYFSDCLAHWTTSGEQEFCDKLLTEKEKANDTHVIEFRAEAKLKANLLTRYQAYGIGIVNQFLVPNDARRSEGKMPLPGGDVPVNFQKSAGSTPGTDGQSGVNEEQIINIVKKLLAEQN